MNNLKMANKIFSSVSTPKIPEIVEPIYSLILANKEDITKLSDITIVVPFIRPDIKSLTLNRKPYTSSVPVLLKLDKVNSSIIRAKYMPSDPQSWTGISLKHGEYDIYCEPIIPDTIPNFRITFEREMMIGMFDGFSSYGKRWNARYKRFEDICDRMQCINPEKSFRMTSTIQGTEIKQGTKKIIISNDDILSISPLLCFRYCTVEITCIQSIHIDVPRIKTANMLPKKEEIEPILSLSQSLQGLRVSSSVSKITGSVWGTKSVSLMQQSKHS
jgi:hypothetical protein